MLSILLGRNKAGISNRGKKILHHAVDVIYTCPLCIIFDLTETDEYYYTEDADYADYYDGDYYYEEDEYADSGVTDQGPSRGDQAPSQGASQTMMPL